jgi:hypothetical protein
MRDMIGPCPGLRSLAGSMKKFASGRRAGGWRFAFLAVWLLACPGLAWGQAAPAEDKAPRSEIRQGVAEDQPSPPNEPPATIEGFRNARFGMSEEQVRQAVRKDFPTAATKLISAVHPSEKTTVLSIGAADLLPNTGNARISYIFGYRSKKLIQTNVVWTSDGSAASDEAIVATANELRDYFAPQNYKPGSVIANRQLADNTIIVFRGSDLQGRMVLLVLSDVAASASSEEKKRPQPPPLTLKLSYILDAAHPDIFWIAKGQF